MNEVSKQKEKPDGHENFINEGSAARTRPTSIEEIMLRRKRKESLENAKEETLVAAQLLGNNLVDKVSDCHESGKVDDRSKEANREDRDKNCSIKKDDTFFSSGEERLDKPLKEVETAQLQGNYLVEKVSDYHPSEKGYDRSNNLSREEVVKDSSRKKVDAISSSREEKLMKEDPVGAARVLSNDIFEKVPDYHESEKRYDRPEKLRHEARKKEGAISSTVEESLDKPMEKNPVGIAQLLGNDLAEKISDYHASEKGHDRSKKLRREGHVKDSSRNKEEAISSSREEKLDKPKKEDPIGAGQLHRKDLVEKVSDNHASEKRHDRSKKVRHEDRVKDSSGKKVYAHSSSREERSMKENPVGKDQLLGHHFADKVYDHHESEKGYNRSEKLRREDYVKDSSRKKEEANSSFREEKLDKPKKEYPVGAAQLHRKDLLEKVSDNRAYEIRHNRSKAARREERVKGSSRKKEEVVSSSREEKPKKEDLVGAARLLGNNFVDKVYDHHESEKGYDRSEKLRREEHVKDSSRKKGEAISSSREEKLDKPKKEDPSGAAQLHTKDLVEKISDNHASEIRHDRSKNARREERVKGSSRRKEDTISSSREEKPMKEDVGASRLMANDFDDKVSDYHESEKEYDRSEKLGREEHAKYSSRKKEEAISSSREEKVDKPKQEEEPAANRKRKKKGEGSTAETKSVEEHIENKRRKKEETNSSCREEKVDKKMNNYPQEIGHKRGRSDLENLPGSSKRLRSLVVVDTPRDENIMKPDNGNKTKNQNGDHKKNRERNMSERHDPGKVRSVEVSEGWEKREQPNSHQHVMREKRKRSRSRDHGKNRDKRSSPLPRDEKATPHRKRDHAEHSHVERSENAVKDRSGKHHFNGGENKRASTVDNKSRRYSDSKSELGGYSPRKRREEASAKAASPPNLSSEKQRAKWDLAPPVTAGMFSGSVFPGPQAATQTEHPTISEATLTLLKPLMEVPFRTPPAKQTTSVDSVQLTESTRRLRRLYAENVPVSASEKSLIECFNGYMLSSGSNHIKGSEPCISCIINKEKSQALVEFLTPQDASAALTLDGCSFAGSNLKIRRPKDYVETTSGELEKKEQAATNVLSDIVEDSSNKIFIGGFPKAISSEMLMEIVSVFGPLKAYRFVINNDLNQRCAFLEYTDGSVTLKACAGLNGMKLGGTVITAVCALPDTSSVAGNGNPPFYGIPGHAKPLLGKPKNVLKLKNVVDPENLPSLSESEVKEILEDVRLECARFGPIKSINIVEHASLNPDSKDMNVSVIEEKNEGPKKEENNVANVDSGEVVKLDSSTGEDKLSEPCSDTATETNIQANEDHDSTKQDHCQKTVEETAQDEAGNLEKVGSAARAVKTRWDSGDKIEEEKDPKDVFEPGCIFIEYGRPEATRDAAHSLHGRLFDNRIVKAEYVSKELYQIRFPSG